MPRLVLFAFGQSSAEDASDEGTLLACQINWCINDQMTVIGYVDRGAIIDSYCGTLMTMTSSLYRCLKRLLSNSCCFSFCFFFSLFSLVVLCNFSFYTVFQKTSHLLLCISSLNVNRFSIFYWQIGNETVINIPPCLNSVAALPCEI